MRFESSLLLISTITFFSIPAFVFAGGNEVGNGGNAVLCKTTTELLDIYEAKVLRNITPDASALDPKKDPFANAEGILKKLEKIDPQSAKVLLQNLNAIKTDISFESSIAIKPIDDSLHAFTPKDPDCHVQQFVILRKHPLPGEKRILADKNIWDKMDLLNRTGILLHESLYEYLADLGEKDSTKARYLVSYLLSKNFVQADGNAYWSTLKELRLPIYR